MRQRIELYIAGIRADIGDNSPVLFNYTAEELRNPTIVKNAYSQQLTLAGTAANNRIFQFYFRPDAAPGAAFNPSKRVPFQLFADAGRLVEAGYVKLDGVSRTRGTVSYRVTLYGGLGGFLYSLQYNDEKTKTLADLQYTNSGGAAVDLGFTINRQTVLDAWANINDGTSKWSIVNFAPCYAGLPDKVDADRALVVAANYDLEETKTEGEGSDEKTYGSRNGFVEVELPDKMTEWQVKDLRSYHQRPVVSVAGLFRAICNPANNGGYTVNLDPAFFYLLNRHFNAAWLTLKSLNTIKLQPETHEVPAESLITKTQTDVPYVETSAISFEIPNSPHPAEGTITISNVGPKMVTPGSPAPAPLQDGQEYFWSCQEGYQSVHRGMIFQAVGYNAAGGAVAGSKVIAFCGSYGFDCKTFCGLAHYTPAYDTDAGDAMFGNIYVGDFVVAGGATRLDWDGGLGSLELTNVKDVVRVDIVCTKVMFTGGDYIIPRNWYILQQSESVLSPQLPLADATFTAHLQAWTFVTDSNVRSNQPISQAVLMSDTMSPAEFLLSYCKRYGLALIVDNATKTVNISARATVYADTTVHDLSDRVDRARELAVTPVPYGSQKLEFKEESAGAGYAADYKDRFGIEYGAKRLTTGFEFNAEIKQLLESYKFKAAPEVKARDLCFLNVTNPGQTPASYPAVFLNSGLTYHLFADNNRDTIDLTVPAVPGTVEYYYWDDEYRTYDDVPRLQLCNADGKPIDGTGVLVLFQGRRNLPEGFYVSDDEPAMFYGNHENPCWILEARDVYNPGARVLSPCFGRFRYVDSAHKTADTSLEMGNPLELDIPNITVDAGCDVYTLYWKRYMEDRYSQRTKVLECYVDTNGLDFSADALRRFYWIDGALWVLNKIQDYDLNGDGVCKCEFVQVQNVQNYVN